MSKKVIKTGLKDHRPAARQGGMRLKRRKRREELVATGLMQAKDESAMRCFVRRV